MKKVILIKKCFFDKFINYPYILSEKKYKSNDFEIISYSDPTIDIIYRHIILNTRKQKKSYYIYEKSFNCEEVHDNFKIDLSNELEITNNSFFYPMNLIDYINNSNPIPDVYSNYFENE